MRRCPTTVLLSGLLGARAVAELNTVLNLGILALRFGFSRKHTKRLQPSGQGAEINSLLDPFGYRAVRVVKFELSLRRGKQRFEREIKPADTTIYVKPGECRDLGALKLK